MTRELVANLGEAVENSISAYTYLPKVAAPFTTVLNRASVTDFSADGLPKFGVDRVMTQAIQEVQGESGPNGERVFKAVNDIHDAVRFVGSWFSGNDSVGQYVGDGTNTTDYVEITFYGTALNVLIRNTATLSYSVDGGGESSAGNPSAFSGILATRNYSMNTVFPIVSNLSIGLHTVKIRNTNGGSGGRIYGYETLNTSATLQLPESISYIGSRRLAKNSVSTDAYNSGFESGILGTRGGHVLVYQKPDGTIAKAVTPTNASAAYLTSADHTNEEILRTYHWREFGAGRADDFSSLTTSASNRSFTLDDGTTTLVSSLGSATAANEYLLNGGFHIFTFVGTGLDITWSSDFAGTNSNANAFEIFVNGVSQGNWETVSAGNGVSTIKKICSGLPYGTHTVRILRNTPNIWTMAIKNLIVYGPKKPTLPNGSVELADYFVMADFVANTVNGFDRTATGVLRKSSIREFVYVEGTGGTANWTIAGTVSAYISGNQLSTDRVNAYFEYVFFGTGFEQRFFTGSNRSANVQASLQSLSTGGSLVNLSDANFPGITRSAYPAGIDFGAGGIIDQQDSSGVGGCGVRVSGLPLGHYRVRFTNNTASSFIVHDALDIITPIHAPKSLGPIRLQNVSKIGSCAVRDLRNFSLSQVPANTSSAQAVGITSSPTTTSTSYVPLPDMSLTVKTEGKPIIASYSSRVRADASARSIQHAIFVNGLQFGNSKALDTWTAGADHELSDFYIIPVSAGVHKIDVYWLVSAGTATATQTGRNLSVKEQ